MTGLEKIIKAIEDDAKANADSVIAKAEKEAEEITAAAKAQAEQKCAEIAMRSESEVKSVLSRAESGAVLLEKKMVLDAKQQMIGEIIKKAKKKLRDLPVTDYFDVILQIVKNHAHNIPGKIIFSDTDYKRIPGNFGEALAKALSEIPGASLTIADETKDIDGGFILAYGDIEENCSFEALFSAARDELQDKVNELLFMKADE